MALYIPHSFFHLVRLLYVRPETFGSYYVFNAILKQLVPEALVRSHGGSCGICGGKSGTGKYFPQNTSVFPGK